MTCNKYFHGVVFATLLSAGMSFSDLPVKGMVMHVDSENVSVWSQTGTVSTMNDMSGKGNDLPAQSVNGGPTIQTNSLNGFDTLYIGGTTEGLRIDAANAADLNVTTNGLTLFAVFKTPYNSGFVVRKGNDSSSTEVGYSIFADSVSGGRIHSRMADDSGVRQATTLTTSSSDFVVYGMVIDPQSGTMNSLYNGELMDSWFSDGPITNAVTSLEDFGIGNNANAAGMELAELVVYDRVLENEEWNDVGFQLGRKYDIPTTYDPLPLDLIDGAVLHVDAEHVGVWSLNGQVARMDDLSSSGNENDLDAQTVNEGPVIQQETFNGYDTLRIDGTANGLRLLGAEASDLNVTTNGLTLFGVFSTPYNGGFVVGKGNNNFSSEEGYSIFTDSASDGRIHSRVADASGTRQGTTLTTSNANFVVYGMLIDPQSGTMTSIYNGEEMDSWINDGLISGAISTTEDFGVGNNANAAGMQLAELVVYDRLLSSNDWNQVGRQLGAKYLIENTYSDPPPRLGIVIISK